MAERDPAAAPHRQAEGVHRIGGELPLRVNVIGGFDIEMVDLVARHEMLEIDDIGAAAAKFFQFVICHGDVPRLVELVAFDQRARRDDISGLAIDELLGHRVAGARAQQVELNPLAVARRGRKTDRTRHERQAQETVPHRFSHRLFLRIRAGYACLIARNLAVRAYP